MCLLSMLYLCIKAVGLDCHGWATITAGIHTGKALAVQNTK